LLKKKKKQNKLDKIIIPEFLFTYLNDKKGDGDVKKEIMSQFGNAQDNRLLKNLYDIASNLDIDEKERTEAINTIGNIGNADSVEFLMKMIEDEKNSDEIRYDSTKALLSVIHPYSIINEQGKEEIVDKRKKYIKISKEQINWTMDIILNKNINFYIREALVNIIYYYEKQNKNYAIKLLEEIYNNTDNKFINDKTADILNSFTEKNKYKNPIITDKEWDSHTNNLP